MDDRIDFVAEGLLDGLEGRARDERLELLERLVAAGHTLDDLHRAAQSHQLPLLPAEAAVGGPPRYTARELADLVGVDAGFVLRLRRASGLPAATLDDRVFIEGDLDNARRIAEFRAAGLTEDQMLAVTRVLGRGLSQTAEAMRTIAWELALEPGATEAELAGRYGEVAQVLTPMVAPLLEHMLLLHLRQSVSTEVINAAERQEGRLPGARDVAVCFADLVGFTRLGERVPAEELGGVAERLGVLAAELAEPPVRLVKTIGDAAMLVCPEPEPLLDMALELVAAADDEGEEFPQLRAGVAAGPALGRAGDWFGRPVNLASRVTGVARPGSVLVTKEIHDALEESYAWSFAGERTLKGVGEVPLFRARHLPEPDDEAEADAEPAGGPQARPRRRARRRRR